MTKEHSHAQVLRWIADEKDVEYGETDDDFHVEPACSLLHRILDKEPISRFRLAPRTIKVGSREINAPLDVAPEMGAGYSFIGTNGEVLPSCWDGAVLDRQRLAQGNVWATEADATAARDAVRELMTGQV